MDEKLLHKLFQAKMGLSAAMSRIHEVSNSGIGFDLSKPLNVMYKELDAQRMLLAVYLGEAKIDDIKLETMEPSSYRVYKNANC